MSRLLPFLLLLVLPAATTISAGELTDHGPGGVAFHDHQAALFWLDPAVFLDAGRETVDRFVTHGDTWRWATSAEIDGLIGATSPEGSDLESVLGPRQSTVGSNGPRWLGFHAAAAPDGYLAQSHILPHSTLDETGFQNGAASLTHGAWLVATTDPVGQPRLDHLGAATVAYFHDQATGL